MNQLRGHKVARIAMFVIGLQFSLFIMALICGIVLVWRHNYSRQDFDVGVRLFLLIICYYVAGVCGWLPLHNRLRPNILPQPFLISKCLGSCFTCIRNLWQRLRFRSLGYEALYNILVNNETRDYVQNLIDNFRIAINLQEERQANDTTESIPLGLISPQLSGHSESTNIPEGRSRTLLRRKNDRITSKAGPSHSEQISPMAMERHNEISDNSDYYTPATTTFCTPATTAFCTPATTAYCTPSEDRYLSENEDNVLASESEESAHPSSESKTFFGVLKRKLQTGNAREPRASTCKGAPDAKQGLSILSEEPSALGAVVVVKHDTGVDPSAFNESHGRVHSEESAILEEPITHEREEAICHSYSGATTASNAKNTIRTRRMNRQCCRKVTKIAMFLIGLLFCAFVVALIREIVLVWRDNYSRQDFDLGIRLFLLIMCFYVAAVCGWLPLHNRLRPNILPQPFLIWKCFNSCFTCFRDLFQRLYYRLLGYEAAYDISVYSEIRECFQNQMVNLRNIINPPEESQANDTTENIPLGSASVQQETRSLGISPGVSLREEHDTAGGPTYVFLQRNQREVL